MTVTEVVGGIGSFEFSLSPETPRSVQDAIGFFGHIAIVPGRVDVATAGDTIRTAARYVGVVRRRSKAYPRVIRGGGMTLWLGDEDDKGHVLLSEVSLTNATLTQVVNALKPPTVVVGTIYPPSNPAARYTGKHKLQSPRKALGIALASFGVEFRVNGDATLDVGTAAQLYQGVPRTDGERSPLVARRGGTDITVRALPGEFDVDESVDDYSTDIVLLGPTEEGTGEIITGTLSAPSVPYKDMRGNQLKMTRLISESGETEGSVASRAQLQLNRFNRVARSFALDLSEFDTAGPIRVGDYAYVYDPELGIMDTAREVMFRGQTIWPDVIRISEHTWPITAGHTVAYRSATGTWTDLTPYVTWETEGGQVTVGDLPRSLIAPTESAIDRRVDTARAVTPDNTHPSPPTGLLLGSDAYITPQGRTAAVIVAEWTAPTTNTDNTTLTDLHHYDLAVRWVGRANPSTTTSTTDTTVDIDALEPNLEYEVSVWAVDVAGNRSPTPLVGTITTPADDLAPPAPADAILDSFLGQLRVKYLGVTADASPWPSDTKQINVYAGAPGFTPSAANRVDALPPNGIGYTLLSTTPGVNTAIRLRAEDHTGNLSPSSAEVVGASTKVSGSQIATLEVGQLTSGTVTAVVVVGNRFVASPSGLTTGQRTELWTGGLRSFNASEVQTVNVDGVNNWMRGAFETGNPGERRIVIDSFLDTLGSGYGGGRITFYAPDGSQAFVGNYSTGAGEAIGIFLPMGTGPSFAGWNGIQVEDDPAIFGISRTVDFMFGRGGFAGSGAFIVESIETTDVANANRETRYFIDNTYHVWKSQYPNRGRMFFHHITNNVADSPHLTFANNEGFGATLRYFATAGGGSPELGCVTPNSSGWHPFAASNFITASDERLKENIVPVTSALADLMASDLRAVEFDWKDPDADAGDALEGDVVDVDGHLVNPRARIGKGRRQTGVLAQQAPARMRHTGPNGVEMIDHGAALALALDAIKELADVVMRRPDNPPPKGRP